MFSDSKIPIITPESCAKPYSKPVLRITLEEERSFKSTCVIQSKNPLKRPYGNLLFIKYCLNTKVMMKVKHSDSKPSVKFY